MVNLDEHRFPAATIADEGGVTWERVSPFLVTLEPSSCFSGDTVWAYGVDLGGPVFLWLLTALWGTSVARPDRSVWLVILGSLL